MEILKEVEKIVSGERQDMYGNPEDSFTIIAQFWNLYLCHMRHRHDKLGVVSVLGVEDVANMMALLKMARMFGQLRNRDNYADAIGYLAIAADRLSGEKE